jgi:tetratricopeptide (TPR) repeat protein
MRTRLFLLLLAIAVFAATTLRAQTTLDLPDTSQKAVIMQRVGITDITISYHRPLVNGRKIWGGLVPMGQVWRAGANENTTIEFSTPVQVEGKALPPGKYGLHMIPNADQWTVIFSKMAVAWGSYTYNESEDALRVNVKPRENEMEDALEYEFENLKPDSVDVTMKWEKLAVPFHVAVTDDVVLAHIREQFRGRAQYTWITYAEAAQYCLTRKINLDEALKWADASIQQEERFENLSAKAEILKAMNRNDEAKKVSDRAVEISTPQQLYGHARQLQSQKRDAEAMSLFPQVVKRAPQTPFGHLAAARIKSAAGDFDGALVEAKQALATAINDQQKAGIQPLIKRLEAKQDINK